MAKDYSRSTTFKYYPSTTVTGAYIQTTTAVNTLPDAVFYLEFLIKIIPAVVFLFCACYRFLEIRPYGFAKTTVYSKFFLAKMIAQYS